ncbi:Ubiquitin-conjugating enzyme E2 Z [Escovopsis weberi]|uniref:Ubiquitin-conjugating enzyme E2 Z n=1 Tax=Escovopsis weberi TaxID=150374 RepID=A0A0M9VUR3_ESCWE|nr:Ubiquitin-conjugating enzyme E2 Z [Escovopsis weberi]
MGPHETPYEFGFFEFGIRFNREYPSKAPNVTCITTNSGRTRFNPNIYATGKVCLTWRGERGEEWSSAQGLESILLSIQSLMSSNPYENEPGFENANSKADRLAQKQYVEKIRHETLRITVITRLENYLGIKPNEKNGHSCSATPTAASTIPKKPCKGDEAEDVNAPFEPFKDLCKRRFLWYFDSYLAAVQQGKAEIKDQTPFVKMPFESPGNNSMDGSFNYTNLESRLYAIKAALDVEACTWVARGLMAMTNETTVAANLQHQFDQVTTYLKRGDMPHSVALVDNNPFEWIITYFGRPMTNLDGGLFRIKLVFSQRFPHEQPRVRFETKIFHHHVAADGTACYSPNPMKIEDVRSHIEAIFATLEDDEPAYDPRKIVNPEATKMFWGKKPDDKKMDFPE